MPDLPPAGPDRLLSLLDHGRLARGEWHGKDAEGRETLCALAALSDEVAAAEDAQACPASVCPAWLAELIPGLDDCISVAGWEGRMRRLGESVKRWPALGSDAWDRIRTRLLVACIDEAVSHVTVDEWGVRDACAATRAALISGDGKALQAAARAARAAAKAADAAGSTAARVAWAAAWAAAWVARAAAWAAARAAAWAARAAEAAKAAEAAAGAAAEAAAWDRLCDALLDAIDEELTNA